jgi:preprotein translocase subunit SecD
MNDDRERQIHEAFHSGSLPPAPASLIDALQRVPDAPVRSRRSTTGRSLYGLVAAAALIATLGAFAIVGGSLRALDPTTPPVAPSPSSEVALRLEYRLLPVAGNVPGPNDVTSVVSILAARIAATGVVGATVQASGADQVIVTLPGVTDPMPMRTLLGQTGRIDFVPLGTTMTPPSEGQTIDLVLNPPLFSGDQIASAVVGSDQNDRPALDFTLKPEAARLFADYTSQNVGSLFAITLDGVAIAVPMIQNSIPNGDVQITGGGLNGFDLDQVSTIVAILHSDPLPYPIQLVSSQP